MPQTKPRLLTVAGFIGFAAVLRVLPHPWNFTPIGAMALFGGAQIRERTRAFLWPFAALILSDLVLGFSPINWFVYAGFAVVVGIGTLISRRKALATIGAAAVASSVTFFLITNFGSWVIDGLYPKTLQGLLACYAAGIPFFQGTLVGDLGYAAILFGGWALAERRFPMLRESPPSRRAAVVE
jgi:hypothetical protein